ncbi:MAG: cobalamin-binding domain-containing protein [Candidatus Omnitrophica bacterium]|nr:cobalamin-binding domain-containing protein [Candidatus Omnitrophota bacterium]
MKNILLVEPPYRNKYPPLGLMKISAYHKKKGNKVFFVKGKDAKLRGYQWDYIYITTLFTFHWSIVIDTIKFYKKFVSNKEQLKIGGVMASLMQDEIQKETGIRPHFGILEKVDRLKPDYEMLKEFNYMPEWDASMGFLTRSCTNKCKFCAVPILEANCNIHEHVPLRFIVDKNKKDLLLLDNNILASKKYPIIIEEIKKFGFSREAKFKNKKRYVDFNQGIDARLLTEEKMKLLSQIAIKPLRIAFDNIRFKDLYIKKILLAKKYNIKHLSNFILFNYNDGPRDFYERLRINVELNRKHDLNIFSFPMKFIPLYAKDRRQNGQHSQWSHRELRGLQLILHATHGVVGPKIKFFDTAFGRNPKEFIEVINTRPEEKILYRSKKWLNRPFKPRYLYI